MNKIPVFFILIAFFSSCTSEIDVNYKDNDFITLATEISNYYEIHLDTSGSAESGRVRKFLDGSVEFKYSYDLLDSDKYSPLFYSIKLEKETTVKEAIANFNTSKTILLATNKSIGQDIVEINSLELPGEQNYYAIRTKNNSPNGLFFIVRKERCLYTLIMTGLHSSDHSLILDLVIPRLDSLNNFSFKEYE